MIGLQIELEHVFTEEMLPKCICIVEHVCDVLYCLHDWVYCMNEMLPHIKRKEKK